MQHSLAHDATKNCFVYYLSFGDAVSSIEFKTQEKEAAQCGFIFVQSELIFLLNNCLADFDGFFSVIHEKAQASFS
mgnify:FL=1